MTSLKALRNVALLGSPGSGRSSLAAALLHRGPVVAGDIVTVWSQPIGADTITLLEPAEETGPEVLLAADAALFVVGATDGVSTITADLWQRCEARGLPAAVVITKLDPGFAAAPVAALGLGGPDFDDLLAICRRLFSEQIQPLVLPLLDDDEAVAGVLDLLSGTIADSSSGGRQEHPAEPAHLEATAAVRDALLHEVLAVCTDDALAADYLEFGSLDAVVIVAAMWEALRTGMFHPALPVARGPGVDGDSIGVSEVLQVIQQGFPDPALSAPPTVVTPAGDPVEPLAADPTGRLCALVVDAEVQSDSHLWSLVRVFSGTLRVQQRVATCSTGDSTENESTTSTDSATVVELRTWLPQAARPTVAHPGDIILVRFQTVVTRGATLSDPTAPLRIIAPPTD